jgi:hypothetical protein
LSSAARGEPKRGDDLQAFMAASSSDQLTAAKMTVSSSLLLDVAQAS